MFDSDDAVPESVSGDPAGWPAPEITLNLTAPAEWRTIEEAVGIRVPYVDRAFGPPHSIVVRKGQASLDVRDDETILEVESVDPHALGLLVANRAAIRRESSGLVTLHAVAVAREHEALLLVGPPLAGKTTIALRLRQNGWNLLAANTSLVSSAGELVGGSRNVTVRGHASRTADFGGDPFALTHVGWLDALPAAIPLRSILFVCCFPGSALAHSLPAPGYELLNVASELPRCCSVVGPNLVDVGLDSRDHALQRFSICAALAELTPVLRVTGAPEMISGWINENYS
jgi:hypothetical protein